MFSRVDAQVDSGAVSTPDANSTLQRPMAMALRH